jgi:rRNA methylases
MHPGAWLATAAVRAAQEPPVVEVIDIVDAGDPRIDAYRDVRERDLVGRQGHFIAEGEVVLRVLLTRAAARTRSLLVAANRFDSLSDLLALVPAGVPVYRAAPAVMDAIVGFHIHRGILALGERAPLPPAADLLARLPAEALVVVGLGIANHDNVGGIFRNAAAFGAAAVLLDAVSCDPLYRKAIRVSVGASLVVPTARIGRNEDVVALLEENGFAPFALSPSGATPLAELARPARAAILLGAEGPGLPPDVMARTSTVSIPMAKGFDSLNVATTSGIVLYHLSQAARPLGRGEGVPLAS